MGFWTVTTITAKIRKLTGRPSTYQISDADILAAINNYYRTRLPSELNPQILHQHWRWNTIGAYQVATGDGTTKTFTGTLTSLPDAGGVGFTDGNETFEDDGLGVLHGSYGGSGTIVYATGVFSITFMYAPTMYSQIGVYFDGKNLPDDVAEIETPITFSGWPVLFFTDPNLFWSRWPTYQPFGATPPTSWTANTNYGANILISPPAPNGYYYRSTVGGVSGSSAPTWGTVPNATFSDGGVTWLTVLAEQSVPIGVPYLPNTPAEVLLEGRRLYMRPAPDQIYSFKCPAFLKPAALVATTDVPSKDEWGPLIACGAALEIVQDLGDSERADSIFTQYQQAKLDAMTPDVRQLTGTRAKGSF